MEPIIRFNGDGKPAEGNLAAALSKQRIAIEIPGDMDRIERKDKDLARQWRLATRHAFMEALGAGFVVKEFCRSIRGQQGPGAYLLVKRAEARVGCNAIPSELIKASLKVVTKAPVSTSRRAGWR